jgi:hypothetical protein
MRGEWCSVPTQHVTNPDEPGGARVAQRRIYRGSAKGVEGFQYIRVLPNVVNGVADYANPRNVREAYAPIHFQSPTEIKWRLQAAHWNFPDAAEDVRLSADKKTLFVFWRERQTMRSFHQCVPGELGSQNRAQVSANTYAPAAASML